MRNAGLEGAQTGIKIARRNINNLRYADDTTLMAESEPPPGPPHLLALPTLHEASLPAFPPGPAFLAGAGP